VPAAALYRSTLPPTRAVDRDPAHCPRHGADRLWRAKASRGLRILGERVRAAAGEDVASGVDRHAPSYRQERRSHGAEPASAHGDLEDLIIIVVGEDVAVAVRPDVRRYRGTR
jgi:hypothetical protein